MIWEVTYNDANGNPLLIATYNADSALEMIARMLSVPSLQPPPGTVDIDIHIVSGASP
jgi:hypothetical protein